MRMRGAMRIRARFALVDLTPLRLDPLADNGYWGANVDNT
jgi:hypothetical protein